MKKIIIWILVIIIVIVGIYFLFTKEPALAPEPGGEMACELNDLEIIAELENAWSDFEEEIPARPVLGSTSWLPPYHLQFIGDDQALAAFEDGHIVVAALIDYRCSEENLEEFSVTDGVALEFPLDQNTWNILRENYGDLNQPARTYSSISVFIEGELLEIEEWALVDENIFVE